MYKVIAATDEFCAYFELVKSTQNMYDQFLEAPRGDAGLHRRS
jgi:hypothetical protein